MAQLGQGGADDLTRTRHLNALDFSACGILGASLWRNCEKRQDASLSIHGLSRKTPPRGPVTPFSASFATAKDRRATAKGCESPANHLKRGRIAAADPASKKAIGSV
jgi:hypothetical protein